MDEIIFRVPELMINGFFITCWIFVILFCLMVFIGIVNLIQEIIGNYNFDKMLKRTDKDIKRLANKMYKEKVRKKGKKER